MPIRRLTLLALLLMPWIQAHAAQELGRPVASTLGEDQLRLWSQLDYFSPALDITNYAGKLNSTSSLDRFAVATVGLRYGLLDRLNVRYIGGLMKQHASRATEPKQIDSTAWMQDVRVQYRWRPGARMRLAFEAGYREHRGQPVHFYAIQHGGTLITWNGRPLATIKARDHAWLAALRGSWDVGSKVQLHLGIEARRVRIHASMTSQDPLIAALLTPPFAPQAEPWHERHVLLQGGLDWRISPTVELNFDYAHYFISRSGYRPVAGKPDVSSQDQLDGYLGWEFAPHWRIYGHGRLYRHFVLGDIPSAYNQRVNHRFAHPFGLLSAGLAFRF